MHKLRSRGQHLVAYNDIQSEFPLIIENWFKLYEDTQEVIYLVLNYFKDKYRFTTDKFIDTVRALESYHRIHYLNERMPRKDFDNLVSNILDQVNLKKEDFDWLSQRLISNEPNLKIRIKELIKKYSSDFIYTHIPNVNKFARTTTDSRNYYTHYDIKGKPRALRGRDLSELTQKNRAIVISCLLNHVGIKTEYFEEGLQNNLG